MSIFDTLRELATARQAAELYGLTVNRAGMACCPFHNDRHPSMKVDRRFYCFACGAKGDAVALTAGLLGLRPIEAARRLAEDLGIPVEDSLPRETAAPGGAASPKKHDNRSNPPSRPLGPPADDSQWTLWAVWVLVRYRSLLEEFRMQDRPLSPESDLNDNPLFCAALQDLDRVNEMLAEVRAARDEATLTHVKQCYEQEVCAIERKLRIFNP